LGGLLACANQRRIGLPTHDGLFALSLLCFRALPQHCARGSAAGIPAWRLRESLRRLATPMLGESIETLLRQLPRRQRAELLPSSGEERRVRLWLEQSSQAKTFGPTRAIALAGMASCAVSRSRCAQPGAGAIGKRVRSGADCCALLHRDFSIREQGNQSQGPLPRTMCPML